MSRINLSRVKRLEAIGNRVTDWRHMTDERLLEVACDYDPAIMSSVMPAFRTGGLDAGFNELYRSLFEADPEKLALILDSEERGDDKTVARMLEERYARAI